MRSKGRCENPDCIGDIQDATDRSEPLLEVDHIQDIALGGPDNPVQMIALCPNCHTIKTHGRSREQLRQKLLDVAEHLHQELMTGTQEGGVFSTRLRFDYDGSGRGALSQHQR